MVAKINPRSGQRRLFFWLAISVGILLGGGWLTSLGIGDWYRGLNFPPFQPPGWVFSPAWVLILSLLAVATWKITDVNGQANGAWFGAAMLLYGAQVILNAGWSLLFFALKRPDFAFGEIILLDLILVGMVVTYFRISKSAGLMLLPYLAWLLFATTINGWIVLNNPAFGH
ncbi:MAG: TspO/MBR family protein [Planctomycetota bacterium]